MAAFQVLHEENLIDSVKEKEELFKGCLVHSRIKAVRSFGLWMAVEFENFDTCKKVIGYCLGPSSIETNSLQADSEGVFTDWFMFAPDCLRIAPPLTISNNQIEEACKHLLYALDF